MMIAHSERLRLLGWRRVRKNSLVGFADVELPVIGLTVLDCPVHLTAGRRWAALPSKPQLENGQQRFEPTTGKATYTPILKWQDKRLRNAFSDRVVALVAERDPDAFNDEGAP